MKINATSNVSFGARFAILGEKQDYTEAQKKLLCEFGRYFEADGFIPAREKFNKITDDCFIIAKPVGEDKIQFQACVKHRDNWYDAICPYMYTKTRPTGNLKDTQNAFAHLVDGLSLGRLNDFCSKKVLAKPMANPPEKVNVII